VDRLYQGANTDCISQKTQTACGREEFCAWDSGACDYSSSSSGQINKNLFVVLAFCYQFGVLLSRSSLSYVKVRAPPPPPLVRSQSVHPSSDHARRHHHHHPGNPAPPPPPSCPPALLAVCGA
jgi:hypothetical protein